MKKIFVLIALFLFSGSIFSQTLEKGNLIGLHESKIKLNPDVSYNQYKDFLLNKLFPKIEEAYKGDAKIYLIEGIRGVNQDTMDGSLFLSQLRPEINGWMRMEVLKKQ